MNKKEDIFSQWPEEGKVHVKKFISAFILPNRRSRWSYIFTENPSTIGCELHKLWRQLDLCRCRKIKDPFTEPKHQKEKGWYLDDSAELSFLTSEEVSFKQVYANDAIFFIRPGEKAFYFNHDHVSYLCEKVSR